MSQFPLCEEMGLPVEDRGHTMAYVVTASHDYFIRASDVEKLFKSGEKRESYSFGIRMKDVLAINVPGKPKPVSKKELLDELYKASKSTWAFSDLITRIEKAGIE